MAENVTTLLDKWQKQHQDHPGWKPTLEDILYVIHGTGSDRDRLYSLEEVRDLLQSAFEKIELGMWTLKSGDYGAFVLERQKADSTETIAVVGFGPDTNMAVKRKLEAQGGMIVSNGLEVRSGGISTNGNVDAGGNVNAGGNVSAGLNGSVNGKTVNATHDVNVGSANLTWNADSDLVDVNKLLRLLDGLRVSVGGTSYLEIKDKKMTLNFMVGSTNYARRVFERNTSSSDRIDFAPDGYGYFNDLVSKRVRFDGAGANAYDPDKNLIYFNSSYSSTTYNMPTSGVVDDVPVLVINGSGHDVTVTIDTGVSRKISSGYCDTFIHHDGKWFGHTAVYTT